MKRAHISDHCIPIKTASWSISRYFRGCSWQSIVLSNTVFFLFPFPNIKVPLKYCWKHQNLNFNLISLPYGLRRQKMTLRKSHWKKKISDKTFFFPPLLISLLNYNCSFEIAINFILITQVKILLFPVLLHNNLASLFRPT